jgi:hypothetical protein
MTTLVTEKAWNHIREQFSVEERVLINDAPRLGDCICPRGVFIDVDALPEELRGKLMNELHRVP